MANLIPYDRSQRLLLPIDLTEWVAEDDLAHFVVEAVEHVDIGAFKVNWAGTGKAQYHPRMMLALLVYCYAHGIFSSRRIERATWRDVAVRFIAANSHPDHDTIATFRRANREAFEVAFTQVLLLAGELGLMGLGTVAIDGSKIDASASKARSVRYDRAKALIEQLEADVAALTARAEAADQAETGDPQALPAELARLEALRDGLSAAATRLEEEARERAAAQQAAYEDKHAAWQARNGRGRPPKPPDPEPRPDEQVNLTDPDSRLMRKSKQHEYRQAYNAQAVVDADGSQLILATNVSRSPADGPTFAETIAQVRARLGVPETVLGDAGFANGEAVAAIEAAGSEVLVAVSRSEGERRYDFRPPPGPDARPPPPPKVAWRRKMQDKMAKEENKAKYKLRKSTVEPVFGIIKSVLGFISFHLRGLENVKTEWALVALAYNCKRLARLKAA